VAANKIATSNKKSYSIAENRRKKPGANVKSAPGLDLLFVFFDLDN